MEQDRPAPATPDTTTAAEPAPHCPRCSYNLTGLPDDRCPECGLVGAVTHAIHVSNPWRHRKIKRWSLMAIAIAALASSSVQGLRPPMVSGAGPARVTRLWPHVSPWTGACTFLCVAIAARFWWRSDSALHSYARTWHVELFVFLVPAWAIPLYLYQHRRWRSIGKAGLFVLALGAANMLLSAFVHCAYYGVWELV